MIERHPFSASAVPAVPAAMVRTDLDVLCAEAHDRGLVVRFEPGAESELTIVDPGEIWSAVVPDCDAARMALGAVT